MCTASKKAVKTKHAKLGDTVRILPDDYGHPFFHTEGDSADEVTCIEDGSHIVVLGVSLATVRMHDLETEFEGVFAQDPKDLSDAIWLGGNKFISIDELLDERNPPSVYYAADLKLTERSAFKLACDRFFNGRRAHLFVADWGYPSEPEVFPDSTLVLDRLPAAFDGAGEVIEIQQPDSPKVHESQVEQHLEDA